MIDNMCILKQAFNKIKQIIAYHLFKQKIKGWYDQKEVKLYEIITECRNDMMNYLAHHEFDAAFRSYQCKLRTETDLFQLQQFNQYIFDKDENNDN